MGDQEIVRSTSFETRFAGIADAYLSQLRTLLAPWYDADSVEMKAIERSTRELLDEYSVVVSKRLEGSLVSTETSMALTPQDLAQLIPALENRRKALACQARRTGQPRANDYVWTEQLLARCREMLVAYGPEEPGDVLWPKLKR